MYECIEGLMVKKVTVEINVEGMSIFVISSDGVWYSAKGNTVFDCIKEIMETIWLEFEFIEAKSKIRFVSQQFIHPNHRFVIEGPCGMGDATSNSEAVAAILALARAYLPRCSRGVA